MIAQHDHSRPMGGEIGFDLARREDMISRPLFGGEFARDGQIKIKEKPERG